MRDSRVQFFVALRTKCDSCPPYICRFGWDIQGDDTRKDDSETSKRHLPDGGDDRLHEDKEITNKGQRWCIMMHPPSQHSYRGRKQGEVFDLDIVQWCILVDNARSPLSPLGDRRSGSP